MPRFSTELSEGDDVPGRILNPNFPSALKGRARLDHDFGALDG
jgi:hypothetical protein